MCVYLVVQSCSTSCDPVDCGPQGSCVDGVPQARILGWVAIPFRGSSQLRDWTQGSGIAGRFLKSELPELHTYYLTSPPGDTNSTCWNRNSSCLQSCLPQPAPLVTSFSLCVSSSDSVSPTALARIPAKSLISSLLDLVSLPNLSPTFTDSVSLVFLQSLRYINFQGSYHFLPKFL